MNVYDFLFGGCNFFVDLYGSELKEIVYYGRNFFNLIFKWVMCVFGYVRKY